MAGAAGCPRPSFFPSSPQAGREGNLNSYFLLSSEETKGPCVTPEHTAQDARVGLCRRMN